MTKGLKTGFISVVIPAHNEASGISDTLDVIKRILTDCGHAWEIIVVDDGSVDNTFERLQQLASNDNRIKGIRLSRNFGKEAALLAGLKASRGDAVLTIDADMQHPPDLIPLMVNEWENGARVVDAVKENRDSDSAFTKTRAKIFNAALSRLGGINLQNSSDYKLLDRLIVNTITVALPERQRFYRGLSEWVGYPRAQVPFDVKPRQSGEGKWTFLKLIELATTAIVSFTSMPLRIVTIMGLITLVFGFFVAADSLISWFQGRAVSGFATTILTLLILGSFIMISLGIIGEYIAKIYDEIKQRPPYLIEKVIGLDDDQSM